MLSLVLTDPEVSGALRRVGIDALPATIGGSPDCDIVLDDPALSAWRGTLKRTRDGRLWLGGDAAVLRAEDDLPMCNEVEVRPGKPLRIGRHSVLLESFDTHPASAHPSSERWHLLLRAPLAVLAILAAVFLDIWMSSQGPLPVSKITSTLLTVGAMIGILLAAALCIDKLIGRAFDGSAILTRLSVAFMLIVGVETVHSLASFAFGLPSVIVSDVASASLWLLAIGIALLWPSRSLLRRWRRSRNLIPFLSIALLLAGSGAVMALHESHNTRQTPIGETYPPSVRLISAEDASQVLIDLQAMHESLEKIRRDAPPLEAED